MANKVVVDYEYAGHQIRVEEYGPDYRSFVDDQKVGWYMNSPAAEKAARADVDLRIKEEKK